MGHQRQQNQVSGPVGPGRGGRPQGGAAETPDLHEPFRRFHRPAGRLFKIPADHVIVLCDDITQAPGKLRIRPSGSAGGHNGLKSIIARLGGENFPRIRIGVGAKPRPDYDLADWVLGKFPPEDAKAMADRYPDLEAAAKFIMDGKLGLAQSKYNG